MRVVSSFSSNLSGFHINVAQILDKHLDKQSMADQFITLKEQKGWTHLYIYIQYIIYSERKKGGVFLQMSKYFFDLQCYETPTLPMSLNPEFGETKTSLPKLWLAACEKTGAGHTGPANN